MKVQILKFLKNYFYSFIIILILIFLRVFVFQLYIVSGNSMLPNFKNGEMILVSKLGFQTGYEFFGTDIFFGSNKIKRLDVVLFLDNRNDLLIKRVVALSNDFYSFKQNKIYIDNEDIDKPNKSKSKTEAPNEIVFPEFKHDEFIPLKINGRVPPNYFLLLGDNRENSTDSRSIGLVPDNKLRGRVLMKLYSRD